MHKLFGKPYNFFPKTYQLPTELKDLKEDILKHQKENKKSFYIIKPEASCQGKGIQLIRNCKK